MRIANRTLRLIKQNTVYNKHISAYNTQNSAYKKKTVLITNKIVHIIRTAL